MEIVMQAQDYISLGVILVFAAAIVGIFSTKTPGFGRYNTTALLPRSTTATLCNLNAIKAVGRNRPARSSLTPSVLIILAPIKFERRQIMCRNIRTLFNFEPPASEDEIQAAALQFVRKVSGSNKPSLANVAAFERAVTEITGSTRRLLSALHTTAPARDREIEAAKARARARARFAN